MNDELTDEQAAWQEDVEATIFKMLCELAGKELEFDTELIGAVRDTIQDEFQNRGIMAERDFYPWIGC